MGDRLGDKAGPRLAQLISQYVLAARRDHAPIEAQIRTVATQGLIDKAGHEFADHIGPLIAAAIDANPAMDPNVQQYLLRTASGRHQLQAVAGHIALAGAGSVLSTLLSNELAPFTAGLVGSNPHLRFDPPTTAAAFAAGLYDSGQARVEIAEQGFDSGRADILMKLAQQVPGIADLNDMVNRGDLNLHQAAEWLARLGVPVELWEAVLGQRRLLLSPADAALGVLRGDLSEGQGAAIAAANGMTAADFQVFIANTGEPLGLEQLLEAKRRGFIDAARFDRGFRQSRYRNEWLDVANAISLSPMSTADAVDAAIQGHLSYDAAKAKAVQNGLEPADFDPLYQTAGEPIAREQAAQLYNRGLMTEAQVKQAIVESRLKPKYTDLAFDLHVRLPEGRQIVAMVTHGVVTKAEAAQLLTELGYTPQVAGFLIAEGTSAKVGAHKDLTVGEIRQLYTAGVFTAEHAAQLLGQLGFDATDAGFLLKSWDLLAAAAVTRQAIGVVRAKYVARHFDEQQANLYLDSLGVAAEAKARLLIVWDTERAATVRTLSEAQIVKAHKDGLIGGQVAYDRLQGIGYSADDALILLGVAPGSAVPA